MVCRQAQACAHACLQSCANCAVLLRGRGASQVQRLHPALDCRDCEVLETKTRKLQMAQMHRSKAVVAFPLPPVTIRNLIHLYCSCSPTWMPP